jgi:hypothetical protein
VVDDARCGSAFTIRPKQQVTQQQLRNPVLQLHRLLLRL